MTCYSVLHSSCLRGAVKFGLIYLGAAMLSDCLPGRFATAEETDPSRLTVESLFDSTQFDAKGYGPVHWLEDGTGYTVLEDSTQTEGGKDTETEGGKDIVHRDPETDRRTVLVPAAKLVPDGQSKPLAVDGYQWSDDRSKLLVFTNTKRVWRRNTRGDYWVLDLSAGTLRKLGGDAEEATLMFAKFAPDGNRVGYVHKNNLYVQHLDTLKITPLSTDGSERIINGTSDWVYEEEFGLRDGFRFSPDGQRVAYWQFDTDGVGEFILINTTDSLYPTLTKFKHSKVGQTNSACRVGVVGIDGGSTRWFEPSDDSRNNYLPRMQWAESSQEIVLQQLNRLQNTNQMILADVQTGELRTVMTDRDEAWVELRNKPTWIDEGRSFLWLSERDGWRHLCRVSRDGRQTTLLTPGPFDVLDFRHADETGGWVYFAASPQNPTQRYLFRVKLDGTGHLERITPPDQPGTNTYHISPDARFAVHTRSTLNMPPVIDLIRLPGHERVRMLEDNTALREKIAQLKRRPTELFRVDLGLGVVLDAWCMKPADFDPTRQYPLLFHVYGEPEGQSVSDAWGGKRALWHTMLTQHGYIVACIENRGTMVPRGRAWRKCVYRQIGILASADQAAATRAIIKMWPYVDPKRIGIWGHSGGGSMSLNAIFRYPDLYSTAMALAFISDQRLYDTVYQERFMGLPDDNEKGYTEGSPITYAHQLKGNLLLVHGTGDDNCHYQNCERLINELIKHNKQFSMMAYPNRTHSLNEDGAGRHYYELMTRYLRQNMPPGPR